MNSKTQTVMVLIVIAVLFIGIVHAQTVTYDSIPRIYQFYPRDKTDNDSGIVIIKGSVDNTILYDSVIVEIDTNAVLWHRQAQILNYSGNSADFLLKPKIYADTIEFRFRILFREGLNTPDENAVIDSVVCGDAFLMGGGAQALAHVPNPPFTPYKVEWVRTIGTMSTRSGSVKSGDPGPADTTWGIATNINANDPDGTYFLNVGIIGMRLGELIIQNYGIPVCIINGACDGSPINNQLRPNGDSWYSAPLGSIYGRLWYRVSKAGLLRDLTAYIWWHGETDNSAIEVSNYPGRFRGLRSDWRLEYPTIQKFYTTQMHVGGGATTGGGAQYANILRQYQTELALEATDTQIMSANDIGGFAPGGIYFYAYGYETMAERYFGQIRRDFYGYGNTTDLDAPLVSGAYFTNAQRNVLVMEFNNTGTLFWQNDSVINGTQRFVKDYFYLHNVGGGVDSFVVDTGQVFNGNILRLQLNGTFNADSVSYLPASYYNGESGISALYEGPWLRNSKNVPALSFYEFPIDAGFGDDPLPVTLTSFSVDFINGADQLTWHTESEINNLGFIILRKSQTEQNYQEIASYENNPALRGKGTTTQPTDYYFADNIVLGGQTYFYILQDVDYNGVRTNHGPVMVTTTESSVPLAYNLYQNYPNPFNPSTTIPYYIPKKQFVTLRIYDALGRIVKILVNGEVEGGYHEVLFKPVSLASGNYYYQIQTNDLHSIKKMILIK